MSTVSISRLACRARPGDHLHAEDGTLALGTSEPGWLSAQWAIEPVAGTPYLRLRNVFRPDTYLHAEPGVPAVGPIAPGWLSAQWRLEPVPDAAFVRLFNRNPLVRFAHLESGALDAGPVGPGWLSAQWTVEKVPGTRFVRLRNRWKADQCLHVEGGPIAAGPVGPGWLSAQWTLEPVPGTSFVRIRNRWKPSRYVHIESGRAEAGEIHPGWLSAQWQLQEVAGTRFVRLMNRWQVEPCLHAEHGALEVGPVEPGWLGAQWLLGSFRRKVFPLALLQRKLDAFVNRRETPLFRIQLHGEGHGHTFLTVHLEDPLTGRLEAGQPKDLGQLELPTVGNDYAINDLNTGQVALNIVHDPGDQTPEVEASIRFETRGREIRINNAQDVDLTGASIRVRVRFGFDPSAGTMRLESFADRVDAAFQRALAGASQVSLRGKVFDVPSAALLPLLRRDLRKEYVSADVSVDVAAAPDGEIAHRIESALNDKIWDGLLAALADGTERGWTPWASVSEGRAAPGARVNAVVDGERVRLVIADPQGGVYAAEGRPDTGWGGWQSVSEGSTAPGGHVHAVARPDGRIVVALADRGGGVYVASGTPSAGWSAWQNVSEGSTLPGAPVTVVAGPDGRITLFLADPAGGVYVASAADGRHWGPWRSVSEGGTTPGGHVTAVALESGRIALFVADTAGGVYTASGSPDAGWSAWRSVSEGRTTPGAPMAAVVHGGGRITLFLADPSGALHAASGTAQGAWGPWSSVADGSTVPGGAIGAVAVGDRIALAVADRAGGVYTIAGSPEAGWGAWTPVSEGRTLPGGHVVAAVLRKTVVQASPPFVAHDDRVSLFVADPHGGVYASRDGEVLTPGIDRRLTRLLLGGDYRVLHVGGDAHALTIDHLVGEQLAPFPESPQAPLDPGPLAPIRHIVVLMMENRSFDHMLGYLATHGGRPDVDGLQTAVANEHGGERHRPFPLTTTRFPVSPRHDFEGVARQIHETVAHGGADKIVCAMDGFVASFADRAAKAAPNVTVSPADVMGYYQAAQLPVYDALAREFVVCNRWHCSHPGGTFPNRFYATTGRLNRDDRGQPQRDNPEDIAPVFTKTVFDHLSAQGVSWRYYEHGYCFLRLFERYMFDDTHVVQVDDETHGFFTAARTGTLPAVSFIDPDFIEVPPGADDHAPADVAAGQHLIGTVVDALMSGPGWNETLLLITYDEHGGFYDHVPPPLGPAVSGIGRYGVRVPAIVVSPWVDRGVATDAVFDHTSIIKTISRRFLGAQPPDLGERASAANDLSAVMRDTLRTDRPVIPVPPKPAFVEPSPWTRWDRVSEGRSTPGAPIGAVEVGAGTVALVLADRAGGVYAAEGDPAAGWSGWHSVSDGVTVPGGRVCAVAQDDGRLAIVLADRDGGVHVAAGRPAQGWSPWQNVSEGRTLPGAPVAAVARPGGRLALFLADPSGGVYAVGGTAGGRWGPWHAVSEGATVPGGHVTAVAVGERIALFVADPAGGVYTAAGTPEGGWSAWRSVSEGRTTPGAPIAAVARSGGRLALFLADPAGGVYTASGRVDGAWGPWTDVAQGGTTPGAAITALAIGGDRIALYVADRSGGVYANQGSPESGWGGWSAVSEGRTAPGGPIGAALLRPFSRQPTFPFAVRAERVALVVADPDGEVRVAASFDPADTEGEHDFHAVLRAARFRFFL